MDSQHRFYPMRASRRGQVIIMLTLMMVPLFGMMGLVVDVGWMHFVKMSAQTAAEAAAQAAVINMHATLGGSSWTCATTGVVCSSTPTDCPANITSPTDSIQVGCMYAQAHGFSSANQKVTYQAGVNGTPPTASGSGTAAYWVTFRAVQKVPQMFSAVLGDMSGVVAARSSAAIQGGTDCIYALNPTAPGAVQVGGTASLTSTCGLYVNSNNGSALGTNGGGTISAPEYDVVGGVDTHYSLTPAPNTGVSPVTDPLASLPVPATGPYTCDAAHTNFVANAAQPADIIPISPGVYCGGIQVKKGTASFSAGTYVLVGGGLSTQNANSTITGTDVLFYNTFNTVTSPYNGSFTGFQLSATSHVTLRASNSGTWAGILFFDDRNAPASSEYFGGGSTAVYQGTIYVKNAAVTMNGNSSLSSQYTILVADTINLVGTSGFNNNYSSLPLGSPIQRVVVVE